MDVWSPTAWWVVAGVLVVVELLSGTFYLLMVSLGAAAAALAGHAGLDLRWQLIAGAAVGAGATALWHRRRLLQPRSAPAASNRDVNLDVGELVQVDAWQADGLAQVRYRGSVWSARLAPGAAPLTGRLRVVAVEGNALVLAPAQTSAAAVAAPAAAASTQP
jgi:membrane protein implicated in regulation of membrane protease activity